MYCTLSLAQIIKTLVNSDDHDYIELWNALVTMRVHCLIPLEFWEVLSDFDDVLCND